MPRGCVTPKQIANLTEAIEDDFDNLSGYDDLSEDLQEKIKKAVENSHVADDDWLGVTAPEHIPLKVH